MTLQNQDSVNIFASRRLIGLYCLTKCWYRLECDPEFSLGESATISGVQQLVTGKIRQEICPIANRHLPQQGWSPGPWGCER